MDELIRLLDDLETASYLKGIGDISEWEKYEKKIEEIKERIKKIFEKEKEVVKSIEKKMDKTEE